MCICKCGSMQQRCTDLCHYCHCQDRKLSITPKELRNTLMLPLHLCTPLFPLSLSPCNHLSVFHLYSSVIWRLLHKWNEVPFETAFLPPTITIIKLRIGRFFKKIILTTESKRIFSGFKSLLKGKKSKTEY